MAQCVCTGLEEPTYIREHNESNMQKVFRTMKSIIILGSGPSLAKFRFNRIPADVHTFGCKNQYRYYAIRRWYPTYYACLDKLSYEQNREQILEMVKDPMVGTKEFFLYEPAAFARVRTVRWGRPKFDFSKDINNLDDAENTATNCAQIAVALGYTRLYLVGIDLSWGVSGPQYFMHGYRDEHEVQNDTPIQQNHTDAWIKFGAWAKKNAVSVSLLSENKQLPFPVERLKW